MTESSSATAGPERGVAGTPTAGSTILVLYFAERAPLRTAIADHLYSFGRYAGRPVIYLNLAVRGIPRWIDRLDIGLVVFHTILLAPRWHPAAFAEVTRRARPVRRLRARRVAIPQDEFIQTDLLGEFLREFGVDHVFTCAPESDWPAIYGDQVARGVTLSRVLTGYLDPGTVTHIEALARDAGPRTIDVGYRAWRPEYWLGRHGLLKGRIAEVFAERSAAHGLRADISLREEDTLLGDDWGRFLLRSRWTIGVEGGASLLDRDGTLRTRTLEYQAVHPGATFEEVEAACFPGRDGSLRLFAISPRHLEAAAARTAQVLVEGEYNGILEAGVHYLAVRPDFSDVDAVLGRLSDEGLRASLTERTWHDVVASGRYDYASFVQNVVGEALAGRPGSILSRCLIAWEQRLDAPSWYLVRARYRLKPLLRRTLERTGLLQPLVRLRARARGRAEG